MADHETWFIQATDDPFEGEALTSVVCVCGVKVLQLQLTETAMEDAIYAAWDDHLESVYS